MTEPNTAAAERPPHWLADAFVGGALALGLITVAEAALPRQTPHLPAPRVLHLLPASRPAPAPVAPPVLIAFQEPLPGSSVGSPFGYRKLPWETHARLHAGVDIEAPAGTPIRAAADGVVTRVGVEAGYGRFIEMKHAAGLTTLYGHMGPFRPGVAPGVALKAGAPVGQIGSTGTSTGAHLHFEIRDAEDRPMNPELFLGRRFAEARELPLRKALRAPRAVRMAYVSMIPRSKRAAMHAKRADAAADEAEDEASDAAAVEASGTRAADGRLHAQYAISK